MHQPPLINPLPSALPGSMIEHFQVATAMDSSSSVEGTAAEFVLRQHMGSMAAFVRERFEDMHERDAQDEWWAVY
jgi:hypothetical protein